MKFKNSLLSLALIPLLACTPVKDENFSGEVGNYKFKVENSDWIRTDLIGKSKDVFPYKVVARDGFIGLGGLRREFDVYDSNNKFIASYNFDCQRKEKSEPCIFNKNNFYSKKLFGISTPWFKTSKEYREQVIYLNSLVNKIFSKMKF